MSPSTTHIFILCTACSAETGIHTYGMLLSHVGTRHALLQKNPANTLDIPPGFLSLYGFLQDVRWMSLVVTPCSRMEAPLFLPTLLMRARKRQRASSYILHIYCEAQQRHNKTDK